MSDPRTTRDRAFVGALIAVVLVLVVFVRTGGDDEPVGTASPSASATPSALPDPPSDEEFCRSFRVLAGAQAVYAATPDDRGADLIRDIAGDLVALGVPASMPVEARGGYYTVINGIYGSIGETLDPGAVPGAAEGDQIAGSDAAFSVYLDEFCPA